MPEVMPCPASMNDAELLKLKHRFDDVCQSSTTPELFQLCRAGSHLVDAIRTLPRALHWTHEPPKVAGIFLAESTLDNGSKKITPIEVFPSGHWRHSDWEKRHGKLSCLLCLGGFGVCPVSRYSRFAGPIAPPMEG